MQPHFVTKLSPSRYWNPISESAARDRHPHCEETIKVIPKADQKRTIPFFVTEQKRYTASADQKTAEQQSSRCIAQEEPRKWGNTLSLFGE
jgi:hypothetical protein